jgi:hypothetical protein
MATLTKNWSYDVNNTVSSFSTDTQRQYREAFVALKDAFVRANWTIIASSNGTDYVTDGTDNNATEADVTVGLLSSSQPNSHVTLEAPAGFADAAVGSPIQVCITTNENSTQDYPDNITLRNYDPAVGADLSSGSTNSPPNANISNRFADRGADFVANDDGSDAVWHAITSDTGDVLVFWKQAGAASVPSICAALGQGSGSGATNGNYAATYIYTSGAPNTTFNLTAFNAVTCYASDGSDVSSAPTQVFAAGEEAGSWVSGVESGFQANVPRFPIQFLGNTTTQEFNRYIGQAIDVFSAPRTAPYGLVEDGDTDPERFVVVGSLWVPIQSDLLPLI